jgi:hypothetical protein
MSASLDGVRAKIERAKKHIDDLKVLLRAFSEANEDGLRVEDDPQTGDKVYMLRLNPMPSDIPLVIGDAAHNLRSALDHLVCQFALKAGMTDIQPYSFPIYEVVPRDMANLRRKIQGIDPGAARLIESLQPYQGGNDGLKALSELDNFDKHRLLVVTVCSVREVAMGLLAGMLSLAKQPVVGNLGLVRLRRPPDNAIAPGIGSYRILQDGDEFCRTTAGDGSEQHAEVKLTFQVAFYEPQIVKGQAIHPTLTQLAQLVEGVVNQFEPLL